MGALAPSDGGNAGPTAGYCSDFTFPRRAPFVFRGGSRRVSSWGPARRLTAVQQSGLPLSRTLHFAGEPRSFCPVARAATPRGGRRAARRRPPSSERPVLGVCSEFTFRRRAPFVLRGGSRRHSSWGPTRRQTAVSLLRTPRPRCLVSPGKRICRDRRCRRSGWPTWDPDPNFSELCVSVRTLDLAGEPRSFCPLARAPNPRGGLRSARRRCPASELGVCSDFTFPRRVPFVLPGGSRRHYTWGPALRQTAVSRLRTRCLFGL